MSAKPYKENEKIDIKEETKKILKERLEIYKRFSNHNDISKSLKNIGIKNPKIYNWPKEIKLNKNYPEKPLCLKKLEEFEEWANKVGTDLHPYFKRKEYEYFTGETQKTAVFPYMSIAIYNQKELITVLPCKEKNKKYKIDDFFDLFRENKQSILEKSDKLNQIKDIITKK